MYYEWNHGKKKKLDNFYEFLNSFDALVRVSEGNVPFPQNLERRLYPIFLASDTLYLTLVASDTNDNLQKQFILANLEAHLVQGKPNV